MYRAEELLSNRSYSDFAGAAVSGLCVGMLVWMIMSASPPGPGIRMCAQLIIFGVGSYLASTVLLQKLWTRLGIHIILRWIPASALGSMFFIGLIVVPKALSGWESPQRVETTLFEFLSVRFKGASSLFIVLWPISMLIMAIFHHADFLIKRVRAFHTAERPIRILAEEPRPVIVSEKPPDT